MSLKAKYFCFIGIIHLLIAYLFFLLLKEQVVYFLLVEAGILLSLFLSYMLYRSFIQPLDFLYSGTDAIRDKDFNVKFVRTGSREMDKLIEVYNEMIDSIRLERVQAEEQHFFLQKLIQASPAGIILLNYDGQVEEVNPKAQQLLQWEPKKTGGQLSEIEHPLLKQIVKIPVGHSEIIQYKITEQYKCEVSEFIHRGFPKKFILIQELSKEMLAAEKRAYGKVIRMMAHEVNNSIGAVNSILESTLTYTAPASANMDDDLRMALKAAVKRNEGLNQFMKNFAEVIRLPAPQKRRCNLNEIVQHICVLMEPQAHRHHVDIQCEFYLSPLWHPVDQKQIEQVLINILKNAIEALEGESGIVRIKTDKHLAAPRIAISDNGTGIAPEVADQLFTPFFSTKTNGQGVGLTLIRDILIQHQASFSLETQGQWTTFELIF